MINTELRQRVRERAAYCCEYCLFPERYSLVPHEIDHIFAEKHGGSSEEDNLCLACWICNRYKGSDLASLDPQTGEISLLFHPRKDLWVAHFILHGAIIAPISAVGRATERLLRFNRPDRVIERQSLNQL
jgi:hypothetical protein